MHRTVCLHKTLCARSIAHKGSSLPPKFRIERDQSRKAARYDFQKLQVVRGNAA
jgi:hypothetical protein